MEGTSISKLSFFVVFLLFTFATCLSTANARHKHTKHVHHRRFHFPVNPYPVQPQLPTTAPAPETSPTAPPSLSYARSPSTDEPTSPPAPPLSSYAPSPSIDEPTSPPAPPLPSYAPSPCIEEPEPSPSADSPAPPPYDGDIGLPPYQFNGCGFSCNDSNDCTTEYCPICCPDKTCCFDDPFPLPTYAPSPAPLLAPTSPADGGVEIPAQPSPTPAPSSQPPVPPPSSGDDDISEPQSPPYDMGVPAVLPPPGYEYPPYQVHGCGHSCFDSNDCDWPCTACCLNHDGNSTCCYEEFMFP